MKVLTIKTLEIIDPDIQRNIHYILRMEHHTDYIFVEKNAKQYASTISMEDTDPVIETIINKTAELSEYTFVIDNLDTEDCKIQRFVVKSGNILKKQEGGWEWDA